MYTLFLWGKILLSIQIPVLSAQRTEVWWESRHILLHNYMDFWKFASRSFKMLAEALRILYLENLHVTHDCSQCVHWGRHLKKKIGLCTSISLVYWRLCILSFISTKQKELYIIDASTTACCGSSIVSTLSCFVTVVLKASHFPKYYFSCITQTLMWSAFIVI